MTTDSVLLLDSSVWLAAVDQDDQYFEPARSLILEGPKIAALDLTLYETTNVAVCKWKDLKRSRQLVAAIETVCEEQLIRIDGDLAEAAGAAANKHSITVYDGAYVACANMQGWTLVSCDIRDLVSKKLALAPDKALLQLEL